MTTPAGSSSTASRGASASPEGAADAEGRRSSRAAGAASREVRALRDVSLAVEPGEARRARRPQRLRQDDAAAAHLRDLQADLRPRRGRRARSRSLLELGAGFHPDFTGRENVYLNGSIHGLSRARVRELMDEIVAFAELEQFIDLPVRTYSSGMYMRLGFSVAAHIQADVLLLDEVFAVGDEEFQRKCFGKIAEFKNRGGTIVFVSHDAQAVERLCDRAVLLRQGEVAFDGPTREAIARVPPAARRATRSPDELAAGLREWGSGEARIVSAELLDADGDERAQFAAGEPLVVRLVVAAEPGVARADASRSSCATTTASCSAASRRRRAELGWDGRTAASASCGSSSTGCRSPTAASTSASRWSTARRAAAPLARRRRPVLRLPDRRRDRRGAARRPLVDAGDRRLRANPRADELAHLPRLAAADGDRTRAAVQALHAARGADCPADALVQLDGLSTPTTVAICCDLDSHVFNAEHTDPRVVEALRATHWFDLREWSPRGRPASARPAPAAPLPR